MKTSSVPSVRHRRSGRRACAPASTSAGVRVRRSPPALPVIIVVLCLTAGCARLGGFRHWFSRDSENSSGTGELGMDGDWGTAGKGHLRKYELRDGLKIERGYLRETVHGP